MNENQAIQLTQKYIESQFPRTCYNCGSTYSSLSEYLVKTEHLDAPIPYDEQERKVDLQKPTGVVSYANCICGATLAITSQAMDLMTYWRLILWAKMESKKRRISLSELLCLMRKKIDQQVLSENQAQSKNASD